MASSTSTTTSNQKNQSTQSTTSSQKTQSTSQQKSQQSQQQYQKTQSQQQSQNTQKTQSQQSQQSISTTQALLNEALRDTILSGLRGYMTDAEITAFAENLLRPQLNAGLESAQQSYEASRLGYEQQIEDLAVQLSDAINKQQASYRQNVAGLETAALARGMGRSSYLMDTEAQLAQALSETIKSLTDESGRQTAQIGQQMTLAAQQNAQTQGRLKTDYASQLAAKVQELKESQRQEYNQNYMSAISAALGQQTTGSTTSSGLSSTSGLTNTTGTDTTTGTTTSTGLVNTTGSDVSEGVTNVTGSDTTDATSTTTTSTDSGSGGGSGGGSGSKTSTYTTYGTTNSTRREDVNKGSGANPLYAGGNKNVYLN